MVPRSWLWGLRTPCSEASAAYCGIHVWDAMDLISCVNLMKGNLKI